MPFEQRKDNQGRGYKVDWEKVSNIVGAHAYLRAFVAHAREGSEANLLGSVKTVDFDHKKVRESKRRFINATMPAAVQAIQNDYVKGQQFLVMLRSQTAQYRARRDELFSVAEASGKSFDWWADKAIGTAQMVRDTGFATVAVLAMPIGGAWAIGGAGVSAAGASLGKYQDTGSAGAAIVAGAGSLLMAGWGVVANGAKATGAAKGVLVGMGCVMDATLEVVGCSMEGKSGSEAARAAVLKMITGGLGAGLDHAATKKVDAVWDEVKKMTDTMKWKDAALITSLEVAKKGTDKVGGFASDRLASASAALTQVNTAYIKQSVVVGG
jgi:hypothetical protein